MSLSGAALFYAVPLRADEARVGAIWGKLAAIALLMLCSGVGAGRPLDRLLLTLTFQSTRSADLQVCRGSRTDRLRQGYGGPPIRLRQEGYDESAEALRRRKRFARRRKSRATSTLSEHSEICTLSVPGLQIRVQSADSIADRAKSAINLKSANCPLQLQCFYRPDGGSVGSRPSVGAPVPDDPMNSFRPSGKVTSRPLARFDRSLLW